MTMGKRSGKVKSPLHVGQSKPSGIGSNKPGKGTGGQSGLGAAKSPPAGQLSAPSRKKGNLATSGKALPDTSKSKGSGGAKVRD